MDNLRRATASWTFLLIILLPLLAVALAYQANAGMAVNVGDYYDLVFVGKFHERQDEGESYRWSKGRSIIVFPGAGVRGRWLELRMYRPADQPASPVSISANGHLLARVTAGSTWQEYLFWVPPQAMGTGTVQVTLETETFTTTLDSRPLGVAISQAALINPGRGSFALTWPALDQLGYVLLFAVALYLGLAFVGTPRWAAAGVTAAAVSVVAWALAAHRLMTTIYTGKLAVVAALALALLPALRWLFSHVFRWSGVAFGEKEMRLLLAIFLVGFLVKAGGLLHPYSVAIDLKLQLEWSSRVIDGRWGELYYPPGMSEKVMPDEWNNGEGKPAIPYSPFYHLSAALFFLLPWRPYDTANVVSVLLDTTKPFLLYLLAVKLGLGKRTGLLAGLLFALIPATFLLHAWGPVPTEVGLWWNLAAVTYLVAGWEKLRRPIVLAGLVVFLLGVLLSYTALAVFMGVFAVILLLGLWLNGRRLEARPLGWIVLAGVLAVGLSLAIYYGQYVGPIVERTIPRLLSPGGSSDVGLGVKIVPWSQYLRDNLTRVSLVRYGLLWPMVLAAAGLVVGWRLLRQPLLRWLLLAWFGTAFLFFIAGHRMDMVDKELWYAIPGLALCAAVALEWLARRWPAGKVVAVATCLFLAASSLQTWIFRLTTVKQLWVNPDLRIIGEHILQIGTALWRAAGKG